MNYERFSQQQVPRFAIRPMSMFAPVISPPNTPHAESPPARQHNDHVPQGGMPQDGMSQGGMAQDGMPQGGLPQGGMPQDEMPQGGIPQGELPQGGMPQDGMSTFHRPSSPSSLITRNPSDYTTSASCRSPVDYTSAPCTTAPSRFRPVFRSSQGQNISPDQFINPVGDLYNYTNAAKLELGFMDSSSGDAQQSLIFNSVAVIGKEEYPMGSGTSKKDAKRMAAVEALYALMQSGVIQHRHLSLNPPQIFQNPSSQGRPIRQQSYNNHFHPYGNQSPNQHNQDPSPIQKQGQNEMPKSPPSNHGEQDYQNEVLTHSGWDHMPSNVPVGSQTEYQKQLQRMIEQFQEGKNPISIVMEFTQLRRLTINYDVKSITAQKNKLKFQTTVTIDGKKFPPATARSKQESKTRSAVVALQNLKKYGFFDEPPPKMQQVVIPKIDSVITTMPTDMESISSEGAAKNTLQNGAPNKAQNGAPNKPQAKNPLSVLQEWCQARNTKPVFVEISASGPPHARNFEYAVAIDGHQYPSAAACKIKEARTIAAQLALQEILPDQAQKVNSKLQDKPADKATPDFNTGSLTSETFKVLNKNPISALQELCQSRAVPLEYVQLANSGPDHSKTFGYAVKIGGQLFPKMTASKIKEARTAAAQIALQHLHKAGWMKNSQEEYEEQLQSMPSDQMTFFDRIACISHTEYNRVVATLRTVLTGRKIIASVVMETGDEKLTVLSIAQGNRFIRGDDMSLSGDTVIDSHAEILARRGLQRYFYINLLTNDVDSPDSLFTHGSTSLFVIKEGIKFHLYISMAPCGDGAIFSPRDESERENIEVGAQSHEPIFDKGPHGLLRSKMECGEGTIPIEGVVQQSWDGILRGDRLRTMSCSDKICSWNCLGLQGSLLSQFIAPVYLSSITLGSLFKHGHLSRAVCCRLGVHEGREFDLEGQLPQSYTVNHPRLGCVTVCESQRDTQKSSSASINWCLNDDNCELTDGTKGRQDDKSPSQISKRALYTLYRRLCAAQNRTDLMDVTEYRSSKQKSTDYQHAKKLMYQKLQTDGAGAWINKPVEVDMFGEA